jgi:formylglycine-generating enzyme
MKCASCWIEVPAGSNFCNHCGKRLEIEEEPGRKPPVVEREQVVLNHPETGTEFILVPGCSFRMGDLWGDGSADEQPVHPVKLPEYYLARTPVTQGQWQKVMGGNPAESCGPMFVGPDKPVVNVSWDDAQAFIKKLNTVSRVQCRLPSEAEWECAARAGGLRQKWAGTNDEDELGDYAWYSRNSGRHIQPVGLKKANSLGFHDMSGNVWEWCADCWHNNYEGAPQDGSSWIENGVSDRRVLRGGSWNFNAFNARVTYRDWNRADYRFFIIGFRLALAR